MNYKTQPIIDAKSRYESHLVSLYGPRPINIFTRLRQSLDLSHAELAEKMFVSKLFVIRLEQGTFEVPSEIALDYWINKSGIAGHSVMSLTDQYEEYQERTRQRHKQFFGPMLVINTTGDHPFKQLRSRCYSYGSPPVGASITEVAKALCMSQGTLQHWERKWRSQKSVPKNFQAILMSIGYTTNEVNQFNKDYTIWRTNA